MRGDRRGSILCRLVLLVVTVGVVGCMPFALCACQELASSVSSTSPAGTTTVGATVSQTSIPAIEEQDAGTAGGSDGPESELEDETVTDSSVTMLSLYSGITSLTTTTRAPQTFIVGVDDDGLSTGIRVGDRIRVVHHLDVADGVRYVAFPVSNRNLRLVDSDADKNAAGAVVQAWIELEAVTVGTVTIEAWYEYFTGRYVKEWAFYLNIVE